LIVTGDDPAVSDDLRELFGLAATLSNENPADFGPPTVTKGRVTLRVTSERTRLIASESPGADRLSALDTYLDAAAARGSSITDESDKLLSPKMPAAERRSIADQVEFSFGGASQAELQDVSDAIFDLQFDKAYRSAGIWRTEISTADGAVVVTVSSLTSDLAEHIVRSYGTEVVHVRIEKPAESSPASRPHDTNPYYGGALIGTPTGICTAGFPWVSGSTSMMVTAGHCYPSGGSVKIDGVTLGSVTSGSRENWTNGTGTVYLSGQSTYRGDIGLITYSSGKTTTGRIYRGSSTSSTSAAVGQMWSRTAVNGDQFCTGGSQSGEICGWVVNKVGINFTYSTGEVLRHGVETYSRTSGPCVRPGDSGGPTYTVRSDGKVAAKGIISGAGGGGSDYIAGIFDPCRMWFTDIYDPYYAFPGVLRTS